MDEQTFERVEHIAAACRVTVEALIQDLVQRLVAIETTDDPILGMFSQEPELMDAVIHSVGAG